MLVFVHGMGCHNKDFWVPWAGRLLPELAELGLFLREDDCGGVFYGDLVPHKSDAEYNNRLRILAQTEFENYRGTDLNLQAIRPFVKKWANAVVDNFGDIHAYLYLQKTHREVNERVYQVLARAKSPVTLIGHSLGSLVSYCALQENPRAARSVDHLIFLGSPLYWFKSGVAQHVDLTVRPQAGWFTNMAGILDIAWPQRVRDVCTGLDEDITFVIDPLNPINGHRKYWQHRRSLELLALAIVRGWDVTAPAGA